MKENENFNQYVESFTKLPLEKKKEIVNKQMKKVLAFIEKLKQDINVNSEILFNKELLDLNKEDATEDDFVEAMFVYAYSIQESLSVYSKAISKKI